MAGPWDALRRLGGVRGDGFGPVRVALALALAGWLPLVLLGAAMPESPDLRLLGPSTHARWLIGAPLLLVSQRRIAQFGRRALDHLRRIGVIPAARHEDLDHLERRIERLDGSPLLLIAILVAAFAPLVGADVPKGPLGAWHAIVSMPLFRVVLLTWIARWLTWALLVFRLMRLDPVVRAAHPDRRGGLASLGLPIRGYGLGVLALGCVVAASVYTDWVLDRADLQTLGLRLLAFVAVALALAVVPGLAWFVPLREAKFDAIYLYGALAERHHGEFEARWFAPDAPDPLGADDMSSHADLGTAYRVAQEVQMAPLTRDEVRLVVVPAVLPLIPVLFVAVPASEVLKFLFGVLG